MDVIKKVPVKELITVLVDLFEKGVDFIDIKGDANDIINKLSITVEPEYINSGEEDFIDEDEDFEIEDFPSVMLSENDLNDLV
jgi:hypothetical protein